jgi:hypothetical protein
MIFLEIWLFYFILKIHSQNIKNRMISSPDFEQFDKVSIYHLTVEIALKWQETKKELLCWVGDLQD